MTLTDRLSGTSTAGADAAFDVFIDWAGERGFALIAEWDSEEALENARPKMIETLGTFRDCLEVLNPKTGVTATMSGPVVLEMK